MKPITHTSLSIGGLTPFTTIDFRNHLAAVIFCQGCSWHCGYCHNTHLLPFKSALSWESIESFLQRRQGLLDGVVFSGGEPTLQKGLLEAIHYVQDLGFKIGLHTSGINSKYLGELLPYLDWVALDIKAPFARYSTITGVPDSGIQPLESMMLILESGIAYECRTTVHPHLLNKDDLLELATSLVDLGVQQYVLQDCRTAHCLDPSLENLIYNPILKDEQFIQTMRTILPKLRIR